MITCKFTDDGFVVSGHSGYAEQGGDIICAAVSAMTMLVCNTITEQLNLKAVVETDEKTTKVSLKLKETADNSYVKAIISGFRSELTALMQEYPKNINVL
ncbi:MAG: hypothetical protein A2Y17_08685 [Clostridiales bacterium GWF2_38_85]|nr:MAG: hypothetical protein A2Y17_08685 [Clostridiales bacterium GWF2_38_85]HBL83729.1 ribosomal-processing cysteine protease Prp [Clostridiales bacterium]